LRTNGRAQPDIDDRDWSHLSREGQKAPTIAERIASRTRRGRAEWGSAFSKKMRELEAYPPGTKFQRLTLAMYTSPSWLALTMHPNAAAVVSRLIVEHMGHAGTRNGDLTCTYNDFADFGIRRQSIPEAITIAEQLGFIDVKRGKRAEFGRDKHPSKYRLTFEPTCDGSPRTDRWQSAACTARARALLRARARGYAGRPQQWEGRSC